MGKTVVIVGAGNAGIPAAIVAADLGAHVVLVDKSHQIGGMLHWSSATMSAAGARLQRAAGVEDSPEAHAEDCYRIGRQRSDKAVLKVATENAFDSIDWLESLGVPYSPDSPRFSPEHPLYTTKRSYYAMQPAAMRSAGFAGGGIILAKLEPELTKRVDAGQIEIRLNTKMTGLILENGAVAGVQIETAAGAGEVRGDAVLLTSGGYMANHDLVRQIHPQWDRLITLCGEHATGDAIDIVKGVGGVFTNSDLQIPLLGFVEDPASPGNCLQGATLHYGRNPALSGDIWVNRNGVRFMREDSKDPDAKERGIMAQPGPDMWSVFDDMMREGFTKEINEFTRTKLAHNGLLISGNTIEELAERAGINAEALRRTVEAYNTAVESGVDAEFGRTEMPKAIDTAPFFAVRSTGATILSQAGVKVNDRLQVVREDGSAVAGLYAAGEVMGAGQVMGDALCSGMSAGAAVTLGRCAARSILGAPMPAEERAVTA